MSTNGDETILAALRSGPATAAEIAAACHVPSNAIGGRLASMRKKGLVDTPGQVLHGQRIVQVWSLREEPRKQ